MRLLWRWAARDVAVSLLSCGDTLSLFSERAVLDRLLESASTGATQHQRGSFPGRKSQMGEAIGL